MSYNIRPMNESDIDAVHAIETEVHIAPWSRNILRDCVLVGYDCRIIEMQRDNHTFLGGYIICRHHNNCCHILNFCIGKSFQSQGYGRAFLHSVLDSLIELRTINHVILEVRPSNHSALRLYENMGFEQTGIKPGYYKDNGTIEDAILLKKILRQE